MRDHEECVRERLCRLTMELQDEIDRSRRLTGALRGTRARAHRAAQAAACMLPTRERAPHRVMIVEVDGGVGDALQRGLSGYGHLVESASESRGALTLARYFRPDFVAVDIGFGAFDGWKLASDLRASTRLLCLISFGADRRAEAAPGCFDHRLDLPELQHLDRLVREHRPAAA